MFLDCLEKLVVDSPMRLAHDGLRVLQHPAHLKLEHLYDALRIRKYHRGHPDAQVDREYIKIAFHLRLEGSRGYLAHRFIDNREELD